MIIFSNWIENVTINNDILMASITWNPYAIGMCIMYYIYKM